MSECQSDHLTARDWGVGHDEVRDTGGSAFGEVRSYMWDEVRGRWLPRESPSVLGGSQNQKFRYCFDLDGTLCDTDGMDYEHAKPRPAMIALVNALKDAGHTVTIITGRGMLYGNDFPERVKAVSQLASWGCRLPHVEAKTPGDVIFDDRGVTVMSERR